MSPGQRLPEGFEAVRWRPAGAGPSHGTPGEARGSILVLRSSSRAALLEAGVQEPRRLLAGPAVESWIEGGRTRHALLRFHGEAWVLKVYRRGGVLGHWNATRYWSRRRFLRELEVSVAAETAGVSTAEVLALILEPAGWGSVNAWLVTRFLPDVKPLHELLGTSRTLAAFRAAGEVVRKMHDARIDHPDLHLGNIMIRERPAGASTFILDWDRARIRPARSWTPLRNLARLWRSARKIEAAADPASLSRALLAFIRGYFHGRPAELRAAREFFRRRAFLLDVRVWLRRPRRP